MAQRIQVKFLIMAHEVLHNLALVFLFNALLISYFLLSSWPYSQAPLKTHSCFNLTEASAAPWPNRAYSWLSDSALFSGKGFLILGTIFSEALTCFPDLLMELMCMSLLTMSSQTKSITLFIILFSGVSRVPSTYWASSIWRSEVVGEINRMGSPTESKKKVKMGNI